MHIRFGRGEDDEELQKQEVLKEQESKRELTEEELRCWEVAKNFPRTSE